MSTYQYHEGFFETFDGLKLFHRFYAHPNAFGTLVILHGHGEHSGRYQKFADILKDENFSLASFDFRGTGQSEGPEVYVETFENFLKDVSAFWNFLQNRYHVKNKMVLLGHSLGGLAAVHWAQRFPGKICGLILSSPCLGLRLPSFLFRFNRFLNGFVPWLLYQNPVYPPHLTHNPEEVRLYKSDTLIKRKMTVRLLQQMLDYMHRIEQTSAFNFPFPVFILMSGLEKVVDSDKTRLFFDKVQAPCKELKIFDDFYHEIFNELEQVKAFDALKSCLRKTNSVL